MFRFIRVLFVLIVVSVLSISSVLAENNLLPSGKVFTEHTGKNVRTWYFCPSGNVQVIEDVYPQQSVYQGEWSYVDGELSVSLTLHYGKRGIGEVWVSENGKGFNEYVDYVYVINDHYTLNWTEILSGLNDTKAMFRLVKNDYSCTSAFYLPELPGDFPVASYRVLTENELKQYNTKELSLMRAEILARYGQKFINAEYKKYFDGKGWYFADKESVEGYLTQIEKRNLRIIAAAERSNMK